MQIDNFKGSATKGIDARSKTRSQVISTGYAGAESSEENILPFPAPPKGAIVKDTRYEVAYELESDGNDKKDMFS
jgi:hypothetical protein